MVLSGRSRERIHPERTNPVMRVTNTSGHERRAMRTALRLVTLLCALWPAVAMAQHTPERIRRTQAVVASSLDQGLPDVSLDQWLRKVLGSTAHYEWTSGSCAGQLDGENPAIPLCGIVAVADSDVTVTVGVRLGEYLQDAKVDRW